MKFRSYAQNFEDVILWRALRSIERGYYIDIGAWSPDADSVTRSFYERGWNGVNVEPNPEWHAKLVERRPRDQNLKLAVGACEEILMMNFLCESGLSTLDAHLAKKYKESGLSVFKRRVKVTTLEVLWRNFLPVGQDVHFLKVDVEGMESLVLGGNDWRKNRPWVVVVESTLPNSQEENHESWERILLSAKYSFVYADGLNRFYLAKEHRELSGAFKYPPSVFDDFILANNQFIDFSASEAEKEHVIKLLNVSDTDRAARGKQIEELNRIIHKTEADYASHLEQIEELNKLLKTSEADRANRGQQIEELNKLLKVSDTDRAARGKQIEELNKLLKVSDADRAARGKQIEELNLIIKSSEADYASHLKQIEELHNLLKVSDIDRAARGKQIEELNKLLKVSDTDRAARGKQIEELNKLLKVSDADRAARGKQIEELNLIIKSSEADYASHLKQIEELHNLLKVSDIDRAARGKQIEELSTNVQKLFSRPAFKFFIRFLNWSEIKYLSDNINYKK